MPKGEMFQNFKIGYNSAKDITSSNLVQNQKLLHEMMLYAH